MIRAVVFDLDDTLYEYESLNGQAVENLCEFTCGRLEISREAFFQAFGKARMDTKDVLKGMGAVHNRILYCQKTLENLQQPPASIALEMYEAYWGYMLEHMKLRDGAGELFLYCRKKGLKTGVCTDLTAHIQHRKLKKLGLAQWVDVLVTSEEAGEEKPSSAIYHLLLDKLGVEANEVLFVGDSYQKDVEGPRQAGMKAVWFRVEQEDWAGDRQDVGTGESPVRSFEEIKEIIDAQE